MFFELKKLATNIAKIVSGKTIHWESSDRDGTDASRGLTPAGVDRIMQAANSGDAAELFRLAAELPEKNWDIFHALQTRHNAVLGCNWSIDAGEDASPAAQKTAEKLEAELRAAGSYDELDTFHDLLSDMIRALLPGVGVSEIVWAQGGSIAGFSFIEPKHLTLRDSRRPKLVTRENSLGVDLQPGKFIVHTLRTHGPDPVRGGLIRPLAWLHCFSNINVKDLLRFIERYGMPFTVARVDNKTWETERNKLKALIRSFGPNGGGVFTRSTELELLQAANNGGDVYFKLLEYVGKAITKVVLGQTATAGDGGGWSNDGAQDQVRQDILEADCRWIEDTINAQICQIWHRYNCAEGTPVPRFVIDSTPSEDVKEKYEAMKMRFDAMGVAVRAGLLTATAKLEEVVRTVMDLPGMDEDPEAQAEWKRINGVKRPITLADPSANRSFSQPGKTTAAEPELTNTDKKESDNAALSADPSHVAKDDIAVKVGLNASDKFIASGAVTRWLEPLQKQLNAACDNPDDAAATKAIVSLAADPEAFFAALDSSDLRKSIENTVYASYASGMANAAEERN